jgi:hypothetical protein
MAVQIQEMVVEGVALAARLVNRVVQAALVLSFLDTQSLYPQ